MKPVRVGIFFCILGALSMVSALAADKPTGKITGGIAYEFPDWFKKSFLFIKEDLDEASAKGKHLMLFMHLTECPYCARTLNENFRTGEIKEFIEKNFDVVTLDVFGGKSVEWLDGKTYTERDLTRKLKMVTTPTIAILDASGKIVLQINGFRTHTTMRQTLEYVQGKHYQNQSFAAYMEQPKMKAVYQLQPDARYTAMTDFKGFSKPLLVMFEDKDCSDCSEFHAKVLNHPEVKPELDKFTVVRLDAYSDSPIKDLDGLPTTPKQWAQSLNLIYRPGIIIFNEGAERQRMDGMRFKFHFKEMLRFVSGKYYHDYPSLSAYNAARRTEIMQQGGTIDYSQ